MGSRRSNQELPVSVREFLSARLKGDCVPWPAETSPTDIESFIRYTDDRGIQPLLSHFVKSSGELTAYPDRICDAFLRRSLMETIAARRRTEEARVLLDAMSNAGLRVLVLKGAALSHLLYPHPGLRPACDVDLLIEHRMVSVADGIIQSFGYEPTIRYLQQVTYRKVENRDLTDNIDLHFAISDAKVINREFSFDELYERSIPLPALGAHSRTLSQADALMLACAHLAQHRAWDRFIWLYDIHLLAEKLCDEEAGLFTLLAGRKQIRALCRRGLGLARQSFDTQYRSHTLKEFSEHRDKHWRIIEPSAHYLAANNLLIHDFLILFRGGNWHNRARLLRRIILTPSEVKRLEDLRIGPFLRLFVDAHKKVTSILAREFFHRQIRQSK